MKPILIIAGTRPEAIKLAPLIVALRAHAAAPSTQVCLTGQHPRLAAEALAVFGIQADHLLDCVPAGGDLCRATGYAVTAIGALVTQSAPRCVVVQGDTISALAGGLAAVLQRVPLAYIESGLRSGCADDPFPEEHCRRQLAHLANWNFAPTERAADHLRAEGINGYHVHVVGNTVIDAMRIVRARCETDAAIHPRTVLVSCHRRENWGAPLTRVCAAVRTLARRHPDWRIVFSLHPNPALRSVIGDQLDGVEGVQLLDAPPYDAWVAQLLACDLILTDSGGMQEEGCALGRPTLVLRETTERPEAVEAGSAAVIGTDSGRIVQSVEDLMSNARAYARMAQPRSVFGDGFAADRIVAALLAGLADPEPDRTPATSLARSAS